LRCVKHRVVFPGCYHELHHEVARGEVLRWVRDWTLGSPTAT
jgi:alpha-beta hydrolase superfamily lysophospholipase